MTVTHTDGFPVVPRETDSVILGMGERVDATITVGSSVPVIAAAYAKDGFAQLNMRVNGAPSGVKIDQYVAALNITAPLDTAGLPATPEVNLSQRNPDRTVELRLAGPSNGYHWTINGKLYDPPNDGIEVTPAQRVRIRFVNESKMFHPMHFHGHTAQVMLPTGEPGEPGGPGELGGAGQRRPRARTPCWWHPWRPSTWTSTRTTPENGSATATTPITLSRAWRRSCTTAEAQH